MTDIAHGGITVPMVCVVCAGSFGQKSRGFAESLRMYNVAIPRFKKVFPAGFVVVRSGNDQMGERRRRWSGHGW
jgi:hypothetical protein